MLTTLQIKLIAYVVLAAGIGSGVLYIKHVFNKAERQEVEIKELKLSRDTAVASLGLYQEANERQVKIITDYEKVLNDRTKKVDDDERGANAGTRIVRVKASCPASSTAPTNTPATPAYAELTAAARTDYFNLQRGIIKLEENYSLCLKILDEDRRQKNAPNQGG